MDIKDWITELTRTWYEMIGADHHKDRDCHWYINTVWSYGKPPVYRIEHYGYINDDISEEFDSYLGALLKLELILESAILDQVEWARNYKPTGSGWEVEPHVADHVIKVYEAHKKRTEGKDKKESV